MSDLISRQAILKRVEKIRQSLQMMDYTRRASIIMNGMYLCEEAVRNQTSAEPEIVRCKDCKHRDPEDKKCDCGHDILWQLPRRDDWFCADAERGTDG